jgi:hypothetical protein
MDAVLKNGTAVLQDVRRYGLIQHMRGHGRIAISEAAKVLGVAGYSAAERHVEVLARTNLVGIELEPHPQMNKTIKFLFLTDTGRRAFDEQRRIFRELAAA